MKNVLFVCIENSNRSQMAEAFARIHGRDRIRAASAGSRPGQAVNPKAVEAMSERGYDLRAHRPKSLTEVGPGPWDYVVTMGCGDACPYVPTQKRLDWALPDPKHMPPTGYREVRDLIERHVLELLREIDDEGPDYVHGYSARESSRLVDQATTLTELLHSDTAYAPGNLVLEAGCGVGAQTVTLASNSPKANILSIDISEESLAEAKRRVREAGLSNVSFERADLLGLPFATDRFDHVFVCFVLEHLPDPEAALAELRRVVKPGGSITVIEGDHGSAYFHPDSDAARRAIQCLIELQRRSGGDSLIGRRLYPLLVRAGIRDVRVSPRMVYADASRPALVDGFTKKTFTAMVEGVAEPAIRQGLIDEATWAAGIRDLYRTAEADGTFCYTFFKAVGLK